MVRYRYDGWGNHVVLSPDGSKNESDTFIGNINPFRYRGYYYDVETGLYYLKTRYYDPEVGRFITIDDISYLAPDTINGLNLYAYCGNNPVMNVDPNGTWSWKGFWNIVGAIGAIIAVTAGVVLTAGAFAFVAGGFAVVAGVTTATALATIVQGVVVGAAIGGLLAGGLELGSQLILVGAENLDITAIAIESFSGAMFGAIGGALGGVASSAMRTVLRLGNVVVGGLRAGLHAYNNGSRGRELFFQIAVSSAISLGFALGGKGGGAGFGRAILMGGLSTFGRAFSRYFTQRYWPYLKEILTKAIQGGWDMLRYYWENPGALWGLN